MTTSPSTSLVEAPTDVIAIAKQYLVNADVAWQVSQDTGTPYFILCALLEKESRYPPILMKGGHNVYGHDSGGVFSAPGKIIYVTEGNFREFYQKVVVERHTSNGVGPAQLTYRGFFPQMKEQGLKAYLPYDNMLFGIRLLNGYLARARREHPTDIYRWAGTWYNAGPNETTLRQPYADTFAQLINQWHARVGELMDSRFTGHVREGVAEIEKRFGLVGGTYPGHGEDGAGYASDFWSTNKAMHDRVLAWFIDNAVRIGGKYIISWERIWSVARRSEGIRPYRRDANADGVLTASERHTNHVHISWNVTPPPDEEEEDMPTPQEIAKAVLAAKINAAGTDQAFDDWTVNHILDWTARNNRNLTRAVAALATGQKVAQSDLDAIQASLDEHDNPPA